MKAAAKVSEENPGKREQPESLPEGNLSPSEDRRQIPIPQMHDYFAANKDKESDPQWSGY
jgi:hypothetical protein